MIKSILFKLNLIILILLYPFIEAHGCNAPDAAGKINGKNRVCIGEKNTYTVSKIALASRYKWILPAKTQVISGADSNTITVIFYDTIGNIKVQGINSCDTGVSSSYFIKINYKTKITLTTSKQFCCDYGNIALGSSQFASPTGGTWSCRQKSSLINSNVFQTLGACDPTKATRYSLYYSYEDPLTTCTSIDSTYFTINPLPPLILKNGSFCQNSNQIALQKQVSAPINLNAMSDVKFKLLRTIRKPGGGFYTVNELIYDADASLNFDFWLKVDTNSIDLGANTKDSLIVEITVQDNVGCYNKDTATFYIVKTPEISFNASPELCINAGGVNLTKIFDARPKNGCWSSKNTIGYDDTSDLKAALVGCDSLNTFLLDLQKGPGLYLMRYLYKSEACYSYEDIPLRINPRPHVGMIGSNPKGYNGRYCENDAEVSLEASPIGGSWSSKVNGIINGSKFNPSAVSAAERDKWIALTFYYKHPKTGCDTAKNLMVFVQSKPRIKILTPDIDTCFRDTSMLKLEANYSFTNKINWYHDADPSKAGFENKQQISNKNPTIFTIRPTKGSITVVNITAITEAEGVCPFAQDAINFSIDTIKCASLGLNSIKNNPLDVLVFPNPNHGNFSIEIKRAGNYSFKLFAFTGELILEKKVIGFNMEKLDINLSRGNYMMLIDDGNGNAFRKKILVN